MRNHQFLIKIKLHTHIFIEGTPTYELILELVCSRLSLSVLNLFHAPGPIGYMLISSSSVEHPLIKNNGRNPTYYKQIKGRNSGRKVYAQPESKLVKLLRFFRRKPNYNYQPKWFILLGKIKFPIRYLLAYFVCWCSLRKHNHVFYLHMDPERTVFNCGAVFNNQLDAIKAIASDSDIKLLVKEHPVMVGRRTCRELLSLLFNRKISYRSR